MANTTALQRAVDLSSITRQAAACDISTAAFRKWLNKNGLPMSDLTGETDYATRIEWEIVKNGGDFDALDLIRERLPDMKPGTVYRLPLELFTRDPHQPRQQFDQEKLAALALTLGHDGQETPIKVTVDIDGDKPLIITHGERRWRAAHIAKMTRLDCMLDTKAAEETPTDKIFRQAADNTGEQLSKWDWACTIRNLSENHGMSDQDISDALGRRGFAGFSRPVVANLRRLFKLPEEAQKLIAAEWLTPSHGKYLLAIKHQPVMDAFIRTLTAAYNMDEAAPTIQYMDVDVRDHYAALYPCPDEGWEDPNSDEYYSALPQAQQEECTQCPHLYTHALSNGYQDQFCTNPPCFFEKDAERKAETSKNKADESGREEQEQQQPAPPATSTPTGRTESREVDPAPPKTAASHAPPEVEAQRIALIERSKRLRQAVRDANPETQLSILCLSAFCEDPEPMTIQQSLDKLKAGSDEFIAAAAVGVLDYLEHERLADLRQHLGVDDVSRETNQADLLETA
ncbi:MAG: ParB/RepB/Spo0J family partition protein [Magnetovibrio sp.]|nr:ParB/RepB/Spo0J family partition protein [Magnetovibrio sp.]